MGDQAKIQPLYAENYLQYSRSNVEKLGTKCGCHGGPGTALYWHGKIIMHCDNSFILDEGTCEVDVPAPVLAHEALELLQTAADKMSTEYVTVRCGTCDMDRVWVRWIRAARAIQIYCSACNRDLTPPLPLASDTRAVS